MVKSPLLSWGTKIRMGLEYFRKPGESHDRSVAEFVTDHFGPETLVTVWRNRCFPACTGGDPAQLSVGSVLLPFSANGGHVREPGARSALPDAPARLSRGPLFRTLKGGLGTLVDALAARVKVCRADVETMERLGPPGSEFAQAASG